MNCVSFVHLSALPPQPGDAGVFTCVATNAGGSARQDVHLSINMRPAFKELPGDVTLNKGQTLALSCHAQGTPPPLISWIFNNSPYQGNISSPRLRRSSEHGSIVSCHLLTFFALCRSHRGRSWQKLGASRQRDIERCRDVRVHCRKHCGFHPSALLCPHQR